MVVLTIDQKHDDLNFLSKETEQTPVEIKCHFIVQPCHNLVSKISTAGLQLFINLATFDST